MTLRELSSAVEACREEQWQHTAEVLASQINCAARKHVISANQISSYPREPAVMKPLYLEDLEGL
jgi:hypothetical protein